MKPTEVSYVPAGLTIKRFHESESFVRGLLGPLGSGKSTACVIEILRRAMIQQPSPRDGIRRSRWAIIRNSYPELKSTTWKTWIEWIPGEFGKTNFDSPITHHIKTNELDMEVFFLALDRPEDIRKLLSLELTGAWINEAREVPKAILDTLTGRVGRYPNKFHGGCSWSGVLMDTNPPDNQNWWFKLAEEETPYGFEFFKQPGGLTKEAENLDNLPKGYYDRLLSGKDEDWIKVYVNAEYGFLIEGRPVYPMFRDSWHVANQDIEPVPGLPILIGVDFGLTPAAVFGQRLATGKWLILDEFVTEDGDTQGIKRFGEKLASYCATTWPQILIPGGWGDPSGEGRGLDEKTAFQILNDSSGMRFIPAPGDNTLFMRLEVVRNILNRAVDGTPGFLLSPKCKTIRKGFGGGYHYKLIKSGDGTQIHETPYKNRFSHPHDALQYLLMGGGEYNIVMNKVPRDHSTLKNGPRIAHGVDYNLFDPYGKSEGRVKIAHGTG